MLKALIGVIVVVVVAGAAFYLGKNGLTVSFNSPAPQAVMTEAPVAVSSSTPIATATPSGDEALIAAVRAGLIDEHGEGAASMNITISKVIGDYAKGMASEQAGGGIWFAAKVNGDWKLVFDGNGIITCSTLTPYPNFPNTLIPECWDDASNKLMTR